MGKISFHNEDIVFSLGEKMLYKKWIKEIILSEGKKLGDISYIFCSDAYLLEVNKQYLQHDYYTDIITFDYTEGDVLSGDLFISVERVKEYASENNIAFTFEMQRVVIHGVLHLLGYKDKQKDDEKTMRKMEETALKIFPKK